MRSPRGNVTRKPSGVACAASSTGLSVACSISGRASMKPKYLPSSRDCVRMRYSRLMLRTTTVSKALRALLHDLFLEEVRDAGLDLLLRRRRKGVGILHEAPDLLDGVLAVAELVHDHRRRVEEMHPVPPGEVDHVAVRHLVELMPLRLDVDVARLDRGHGSLPLGAPGAAPSSTAAAGLVASGPSQTSAG